jgi:hypothetical protein
MTKNSFKTPGVMAAVILVALIAGIFIFKASSDKGTQPDQGQTTTAAVKPAGIGTADFTYQKPAGWAQLAQEVLDANHATSGIGRSPESSATFTIRTASSVPTSDADLKDSTLNELRKLSQFELLNSGPTQVDGKAGQKFTYQFEAADKIKQEMSVIVYKQKTFFLLFSSADTDFDKQAADFAGILSGFKFK